MRCILSRGVLASGASFVAAALLVRVGSAAPETAPAAVPNPIRSLSARGADVVERIRTKVIVVRTALDVVERLSTERTEQHALSLPLFLQGLRGCTHRACGAFSGDSWTNPIDRMTPHS